MYGETEKKIRMWSMCIRFNG